ncbi:MAG: hypothetical protein M0P39_11675 [Rhodocyclaceae bacterium]|jgi:MSHA biogenesis protein MshI|nr:hypothetical protein [Rhodocyclaceae bacterium]
MLPFGKRKQTGLTAVCLYPGRMDLARVRYHEGWPRVEMLESFERQGDDVQALTRLRKKFSLDRCACTTLAVQGDYQLLQVEAPNVGWEEMKAAVRWKIKDMIDFPVERATVDVLDIPVSASGNRGHSVFVVTARNDTLVPVIGLFDAAGVGLEIVDIPELAQRNLAALCEEKDRGLALLCLDEAGGLLTFTYRGELYMVRRVEIGMSQLVEAGEERRAQLLERVGLELQRSLDNFDRQYSFIPLSKLLLSPGSAATMLCSFLGDYLSMPVEVMDLAAVMDIGGIPGLDQVARQAQCLPTLGAALRPQGGTP